MFIHKAYYKVQNMLGQLVNQNYERRVRRRLQNDNFSIICSNCIGGVIYHRLGKQFLSPTINMWFRQKDFLKFVGNLQVYLEKELEFVDSEYDHPVARLGDVHLYFNHAKSEAEARTNWERRKTRVNYNNLYIIMYDKGDITEEDIRHLELVPCKNKLVFSDKVYPDIDYVLTIKPKKRFNGDAYLDQDWLGIRTFEKKWNFVKWLNQ